MSLLSDLLDVATEAAYIGGRKTLSYFNVPLTPEIKADGTPVTLADREAEKAILSHVRRYFPDHDILAEESGAHQSGTAKHKVRWIIDPLDGTKTFVRGVPIYGTLVGVEIDGVPTVGACYIPAMDEMVSGALGLGARWNGRPARVSNVNTLADAALLVTDPVTSTQRGAGYSTLAEQCKFQRSWGDCYGYVLVATGRAEIMIDPRINPWDICALMPILTEAGGHLSTWTGEKTIWGPDALCANAKLWPTVIDHLKQCARI